MKLHNKNALLALLGLMIFNISFIVKADEQSIKAKLAQTMPNITIDSIQPAEVKGLYQINVGANIFYVSEDGNYLVQGHLIDIAAKTDLTDAKLAGIRSQALTKLGDDKMIVFKPEKSEYKVSIFTDIDCGYCRKLHAEIDKYMAKGITVQYLFYPRSGKGSGSYNKAVSVWCAEDRHAALTAAKKGSTPDLKTCDNPIDEHMKLGVEFEARGTPMIVTEKGNIYPGYVPADQLAGVLANE